MSYHWQKINPNFLAYICYNHIDFITSIKHISICCSTTVKKLCFDRSVIFNWYIKSKITNKN